MIIEMRTYTLKPGNIPTFEERFGSALHIREKCSKLAAFWHTEVGPLNQVIHVWPYESLDQRAKVRAEASKAEGWPPNTRELTLEQRSEIFLPAPFSPPLEPRQLGGDLRDPHVHLCAREHWPAVMERWAEKVPGRIALSPLVGAWHSELGGLNKWCHIWAYKDAGERSRIRAEAVAKGVWPPGGPPGALLKQENMLVVPAAFSPLE